MRSRRREPRPLKLFEVLPTWVDTAQTASLGVGKLDPEIVAQAAVAGIASDQLEIRVGRAGIVSLLSRVCPGLAEALVARSTR